MLLMTNYPLFLFFKLCFWTCSAQLQDYHFLAAYTSNAELALDGVVRSIRYPLSQYLAKTFGICIFYLLKSSALFSSNSDVFISMGNFWKPLQWNVYMLHGDERLQSLICCYLNSWFASCMINSCVATFGFSAMAASISNMKFMYILLVRSSQFMYILTAALT
jgi:hypothetical protein